MIYNKYFLIVYLHKYIGAKENIDSKAKKKIKFNDYYKIQEYKTLNGKQQKNKYYYQ